MANERLEERLAQLSSEVLAELLVRHATGNKPLRRELITATSDVKSLVAFVRGAINKLSPTYPSDDYVYASKVRTRLDIILERIEAVASAVPSRAFELVCELYANESYITKNVDDVDETIVEVFCVCMPKLAAEIAESYSDEKHTTKWLLKALEVDSSRSGSYLVDALASVIPESVLRTLLADTAHRVEQNPRTEFENRDHAFVLRRLLVAVGDTTGFIEVCTHNGSMIETDVLTLVQMYIDHGAYDVAEQWLHTLQWNADAIPTSVQTLQYDIDRGLKRPKSVHVDVMNDFLKRPYYLTYNALKEKLSSDALAKLFSDVMHSTADPDFKSMHVVWFLVSEDAAKAERIFASFKKIERVDFDMWVHILEAFESTRRPLGATIALRVLLDDILDNKRTEQYGHATRYYARLWFHAQNITKWSGIPNNDTYMAAFQRAHAFDSLFWYTAVRQPKPVEVPWYEQ